MAGPSRERAEVCWIASLKYAPVMWSIGRALGEPIAAAGLPVRYLLAGDYAWLTGSDRADAEILPTRDTANPLASLMAFVRSGAFARIRRAFAEHPPRVLVVVNLNQLVDRVLVRLARRANPQVRVVLMLHEPYTEDKLVYGWRRSLLLVVFERLTRGLARRADAIVLPSANALRAYRHYYSGVAAAVGVIDLPLVDEACPDECERRYVSFLGQISHAHQKGLDLFLEMVAAATGEADVEYRIITGNDTAALADSLDERALERLDVVSERPLSDAVIHRALRESLMVVILQRRVMQSGALPMALMNGTPVIVSDLPGLTQFVEHGDTGWVVPVESDLATRLGAVEEIRARMPAMAERCRLYFEKTFSTASVSRHVPWLLGESDPPDPAI